MAEYIYYNINVKPTETPSIDYGVAKKILASEVGKTLGGSCAAVADCNGAVANVNGYADATVNYRNASDGDDTTDISSETTASFVFIKNTGYEYSTATALGDALSKSLKVMVGTTLISLLDAGECIVLKDDNAGIDCSNIHVRTVDTNGNDNTSAGHLAVEFLVMDL